MMEGEKGYLTLLKKVIDQGLERQTRNGRTLESFGERIVFDLSDGSFPLLTTKRVFWKGVVCELLWFLRGSTDVTELQRDDVHIWDANSSREFLDSVGMQQLPEWSIGAGYGYQWRSFGGEYPRTQYGFDQLRYILQKLMFDPSSRRIFLSAWNPRDMDKTALMPCHVSYNFYLSPEKGLSCQVYLRSNDLVAGCPFNIASSALLTSILAHVIGCPVDRVILCIGNAHIYQEHIEAAKEQLSREPKRLPRLKILKPFEKTGSSDAVDEALDFIESLTIRDLTVEDYDPHPRISIKMVP